MRNTDETEFLDCGLSILLKGSEVARILNISRALAYQLIQRGEIPCLHIGRAVRVRPKDLEAYILANISSNRRN